MIKSYAHHTDLSLPTRRRNHRNTKKRNINYWYSSTDYSIFIIFTCVESFYWFLSVSWMSIRLIKTEKGSNQLYRFTQILFFVHIHVRCPPFMVILQIPIIFW